MLRFFLHDLQLLRRLFQFNVKVFFLVRLSNGVQFLHLGAVKLMLVHVNFFNQKFLLDGQVPYAELRPLFQQAEHPSVPGHNVVFPPDLCFVLQQMLRFDVDFVGSLVCAQAQHFRPRLHIF